MVTVIVVDADDDTATASLYLEVEPTAVEVLKIVKGTSSIRSKHNQPFEIQYVSSGGVAPITWTLKNAPYWLRNDQDGKVYYDASVGNNKSIGTHNVTVGVFDSKGSRYDVPLEIIIYKKGKTNLFQKFFDWIKDIIS